MTLIEDTLSEMTPLHEDMHAWIGLAKWTTTVACGQWDQAGMEAKGTSDMMVLE